MIVVIISLSINEEPLYYTYYCYYYFVINYKHDDKNDYKLNEDSGAPTTPANQRGYAR